MFPELFCSFIRRRLSQKISKGLSSFTGEGYVYRVDLRLRPEGKAGSIAETLDGFERYYRNRIGAWERLALLKAWPVAGSRLLGRRFLSMSRPYIYAPQFGGYCTGSMSRGSNRPGPLVTPPSGSFGTVNIEARPRGRFHL